MASELETAKIPSELTGLAAAQQALAALGAGAEEAVGAEREDAVSSSSLPTLRVSTASSEPRDLSPLLAALAEVNANLNRIAALIEQRPLNQTPTY